MTFDQLMSLSWWLLLDVCLNDRVYWRCVPARVWSYTIGGYQVIKKWLSYRERPLLGRDLKPTRRATSPRWRAASPPSCSSNPRWTQTTRRESRRLCLAGGFDKRGRPSMICPHCGAQADGNFCSNCGARLGAAVSPPATVQSAAQTQPVTVATSPAAAQAPPVTPPIVQTPPTPSQASAALCPVCRAGTLAASEHKGLLHTTREIVCDRCGAVLVDHGGQPRRFELTETRNPAEPNWQRYKHETLTVAEWQRIAAGGLSDAELQEADLVEAMSELRSGRSTSAPMPPPDPAERRRADRSSCCPMSACTSPAR